MLWGFGHKGKVNSKHIFLLADAKILRLARKGRRAVQALMTVGGELKCSLSNNTNNNCTRACCFYP